MSAKLSIRERDSIRSKILQNTFEKRLKDMEEFEDLTAQKIFNRELGKDVIDKINSLPANWFPTLSGFSLLDCPRREKKYHNHAYLNFKNRKIAPTYLVYNNSGWSVSQISKDEYNSFYEAERALLREREQLAKDIQTVLNGCSTTKQLQDRWPEAFDLLPKPKVINLPAINVADLNKQINWGKAV